MQTSASQPPGTGIRRRLRMLLQQVHFRPIQALWALVRSGVAITTDVTSPDSLRG